MPDRATIIDTSDWQPDADYPIHPVGTRDKRVVICPDPVPCDFLVPQHRYLLKFSNPRAPSQFLSEVMAYRMGILLDVPVPPTFPAIDGDGHSPAALIEFFLERPGSEPIELIHGGDYCVRYFPEFERIRGRDHTLDRLLQIMENESRNGLEEDFVAYWSKVFLFDALIGNSDRHQDNWGILWSKIGQPPTRVGKLTPAFDNGTSLGYELLEERLAGLMGDGHIATYAERGRHHIRQQPGDKKGFGHFDLIVEWLRRFPASRETIVASLAALDPDAIEQHIDPLRKLEIPESLSENRLRFVLELLSYRSSRMREIVGL